MKKKLFITFILSCLIGLQAWFLFITFHYPFYGIELQRSTQNEWVISGFQFEHSSLDLGLQVGDKIIKVNHIDPILNIKVKKWASIDQTDTITVSRNGIQFEVFLRDNPQDSFDYMSLFGEIISLCIALIIYLKIPNSSSARFLALVFLLIGIIFMSIAPSARGDNMAKFLVASLVGILPLVFLHAVILFFKEKTSIQLPIKFLHIIYGIMAVSLIPRFSFFTTLDTYHYYRLDFSFVLVSFLFGIFLNFIMFLYIYFKYRKENSSIQTVIKMVWLSLFISFSPLAFLSFVPILIHGKAIVDPIITGFFVMFFPISFTYLIVTKQLYDINLILRRILYTTVISIIPSAMIIILLSFIFYKEATFENLTFSFLFILTIISFLLYLLEYFVTKFDVIMFPRKYQLQLALKNISTNLRTIRSFRELKDIILMDIVTTLNVYGGAIVFQYQQAFEIIGEGDINLQEIEQGLRDGKINDAAYSVFEINRNEEYASYLVTSIKKTNTLLGMEERQWLDLIITYLAVSLENVYLIRKMTMKLHELASQIPNEQAGEEFVWLRKSLFELQEQERFRIATDLHDTTMQDILLIRRKLITYIENNADRQQVIQVIKHLDMVNENLRQSCFELNPHLLQKIGLVQTIQATIDLDIGSNEFETAFHVEGTSVIERVDLEVKKHLFRIFQELMHNAKKHAKASKVLIKLTVIENYICLFYKDNGVGLDTEELANDKRLRTLANSGLGLEQMKSRVVHLNGHLDLQSNKGNGLELTIRIPITLQEEMIV